MAGNLFKGQFAEVWERKGAFLGVFFIVLALSYGALFAVDFIPEEPEEAPAVTAEESSEQDSVAEEPEPVDPLPTRIVIDEIGVDVTVLNPQSRSVADLDAALREGVVRHPDSATFREQGNMFLFGHSSYLPNVFNDNYQAFNGIQDLTWGDIIRVQSGDTEYMYRVKRVYEIRASEATIVLDDSASKLTLVTCDSFGSKDDRFVVEADLVSSRPLSG